MAQGKILLKPDTLWTSVKEQTEYALQCGALLSIPTEFEFVEQDNVRFLVRILSNLNRKDDHPQKCCCILIYRTEFRSQESEFRIQESEFRIQNSEFRSQNEYCTTSP